MPTLTAVPDAAAFAPRRPRGGPPRVVLGLSALAHDPAACLVVDGWLAAAVEEERLNRQKDTRAFPHRAIRAVLDAAGVRFADVDAVAYYWDDRGQLASTLARTAAGVGAAPAATLRLLRQRLGSWRGPALLRAELRRHGDGALPPIAFLPHHECHLAAAWLSAPFAPDAAMVVDGRGEVAATTLYRRGGDEWPRAVESRAFPHSLGVFFGAVTQQLGYDALGDEYKVMGLASYGGPDPYWRARVRALLRVEGDGRYALALPYLRPEHCGDGSLPWLTPAGQALLRVDAPGDHERSEAACNLAFAAQELLEEALGGQARRALGPGRRGRLVLAGGVAMNARAVGRLRGLPEVAELHLPLAPHDAGACIGAALALLRRTGGALPDPASLRDPYQGPAFGEGEVREALARCGWPCAPCADPAAEAAEEVARGRIVGWFSGRMEFGARALGARSILADPRRADMKARINRAVKYREGYRPFAPAVLAERAGEFFETPGTPLMGEVVNVRPEQAARIPAVVHVDGTARPQTVAADSPNAPFRRLLESFAARTGIPLVLNTSFNVKGEPIVCTPEDALRCFAASGLDSLYLGAVVVRKRPWTGEEEAGAAAAAEAAAW